MKLKRACMSFAILLLAGAVSPVIAADMDDPEDGLKDSVYDGVPVPAPAPAPLYDAEWYVRADFGYTFKSTNDVSVNGRGFTPFGEDDLDGPAAISVGFGRYIGDNLRAEFALDFRNDFQVGDNSQPRTEYTTETVFALTNRTYTHTWAVARADEARIGHYTGLVNLYYDFANESRFTPYVGGGGGLVVHTFKRRHNEVTTCVLSEYTNPAGFVVPYPDNTSNPACRDSANTETYTSQANSVETGYGLAANLMAGVSMEVREDILVDVNYRYMWMGGDVKILAPTFLGSSTVNIGDTSNHELRVGMRWNIN